MRRGTCRAGSQRHNRAWAQAASCLLLDVGGLAVAQPQRLGGAPAGKAIQDRTIAPAALPHHAATQESRSTLPTEAI